MFLVSCQGSCGLAHMLALCRFMLILRETTLALTIGSIHAMVFVDLWRFHRVNKFSVVSVLLVLVITLVIIGGGP